MNDLEKICADAYEARVKIGTLDTDIKNKVLNDAADNLLKAEKEILEANKRDVATAEENMKAKSMIDRLSLDHDRLLGMADGLRQIAKLADPIGEVMSMAKRPNGLIIGKRRVAIGVVGIIFEARPNVTSDAFGLCFKTGNCVILKGGSDAINTNIAIVKALKKALTDNLVSAAALALIESTDRETTNAFMKMDQWMCSYQEVVQDSSKMLSKMLQFLSSRPVQATAMYMWTRMQTLIWLLILLTMQRHKESVSAMHVSRM